MAGDAKALVLYRRACEILTFAIDCRSALFQLSEQFERQPAIEIDTTVEEDFQACVAAAGPTVAMVKEWFGSMEKCIATVAGEVSGGLVVRDLVCLDCYQQWAAAQLALAKSLPNPRDGSRPARLCPRKRRGRSKIQQERRRRDPRLCRWRIAGRRLLPGTALDSSQRPALQVNCAADGRAAGT